LLGCRSRDGVSDDTVMSNPALQIHRSVLPVGKDMAITDLNAIAIRGVARSALGDDENTSTAVITGARNGCACRSGITGNARAPAKTTLRIMGG